MKKSISIILSIVIAIAQCLFLFGCNSKATENEPIVIWAYDYYIDAAKEAVKLYTQTHPDAKFDIVELGQDDMVQKLNLTLSSGNKDALPDIICEEDYNLKSYIKYYNDCFVDLTDYINPNLYVDFKVKNCTVDGKIWAVPYDTGVSAWFYRIDILNEAGYSEKDVENITWDKFIEIGQSVFNKTGKYLIPLVPEGNIEGRIILQSSNSWYYKDDGELNIKNNPTLFDMSKTIKKIYNSGVVDKVASWDDIITSFYNGNSAGVIGGSWWANTIMENKEQCGLWRITQVPRMEGNDLYTNYGSCGGCSWLVCNTDHKEVAIDFLMNTLATSNELANNMVKIACVVPALKTAFHVENAVNGEEFFGGQNLCEQMAEWGENIPYCNYSTNSYEIAYAHGGLLADYCKDNMTLDEIFKQLNTEAEAIEAK